MGGVIPYLVVFAAAAVAAFAATPLVRRFSLKIGAVDHPSDRKVHPTATPTLGGLAILFGVVVAIGLSHLMPAFDALYLSSSETTAAIVGGLVIVGVGVYDDMKGMSALGKLSGQLVAAGVLVLLGVQLLYFWFPGQGILSLSADLAVPLTVIWILAMINAINFVDGLDGLAAGMVTIAAVAFFLYVYRGPGLFEGASTAALLCAVTAGACVGFLPWNFNPAKIFMGDSGSGLLGLLLGVATISGVGRNPYPPSGGDVAAYAIPVLVPLLVLAIPFLDVTLAVIRRFRKNRPLSHADKEHIHHQLLDLGHSHRQAVLMMYLWSGLISISALAVAFIDGREKVAVILGVVLVIFAVTVIPRLRQYWRMVKEDRASGSNGRVKGGAHRKGRGTAGAGAAASKETDERQPA